MPNQKQLNNNIKQKKVQHQKKINQQQATIKQKNEDIILLLAQLENLKSSNNQNNNNNSPKHNKTTQVQMIKSKTKSVQTELNRGKDLKSTIDQSVECDILQAQQDSQVPSKSPEVQSLKEKLEKIDLKLSEIQQTLNNNQKQFLGTRPILQRPQYSHSREPKDYAPFRQFASPFLVEHQRMPYLYDFYMPPVFDFGGPRYTPMSHFSAPFLPPELNYNPFPRANNPVPRGMEHLIFNDRL